MNTEEVTFDTQDVEKNKSNGILMAILVFLFFLPLVSEDMKNSPYLKFYANQSLLLFILYAACGIVSAILAIIPIIGWIIAALLPFAILALHIMLIVNAVNGKGKKLPFIGTITIIK